jgi:hypothetical protein
MHGRCEESKPGDRVRLSALGKERCPRLKTDTGTSVKMFGDSAARVVIDGRTGALTLHPDLHRETISAAVDFRIVCEKQSRAGGGILRYILIGQNMNL